ncbi:malto-oligosyltrehalose synthase [Acidithiobacillus ferrivorans]|uniref:malto-oligosyltrehalose synthase n=1 Tax=Acidithiobacillus ferrivorans TaxID=160808 RepID=UPI001C068A01|nr:malto-oligosyltrehalose synthase [Acidithiobacillus ferrivorans]MBU2851638.1 malto-oligosyltrehalose synthase [Acidithiobacillus ferrivorans]
MKASFDKDLIRELCQSYGVLEHYHNAFGRKHVVPQGTLLALLNALGVPTENAQAAREALRQKEAASWQSPLPPLLVQRITTEPPRVALSLPADVAQEIWHWRFCPEEGEAREGTFQPADLELLGEGCIGTRVYRRYRLELPFAPRLGYHHLILQGPDGCWAEMPWITVPEACYTPEAIQASRKVWGPALQLYALRSGRNWGMGDFSDLLQVLDFAAQSGAELVGLNPLHALFPDNPHHASPYSPSSRKFLNILYVDVEAVPEFAHCEAAHDRVYDAHFQADLRALRGADLVDYGGVAAAKREILEILYRTFRETELPGNGERARAFRQFQIEGGAALFRLGVFEALREHLQTQDPPPWGWPIWPEKYRRPEAPAVAEFATQQPDRVEFFQYLQWVVAEQLDAVGQRSYALDLGIGLYQDIAVGVDPGGFDAWNDQDLYVSNIHVGAPPDAFNRKGQDWGLQPWHPLRLREAAYAPFVALLRANMRVAGAIRLDHILGLMRLYWIPAGESPARGGYVRYPLNELLGILTLESQRHHCLVVGEDLGMVTEEIRDALQSWGILSYRVLLLEADPQHGYRPPEDYPAWSVAALTTHDLPTLAGFWQGLDLDTRAALDLIPDTATRDSLIVERARDRSFLLLALEREGLLPRGVGVQPVDLSKLTDDMIRAIHHLLARAASAVLLVQMDDVLAVTDQSNLPGTADQYPNWRRKLPLTLEQWAEDPHVNGLFATLREVRPVPPRGQIAEATIPIPRATYRLQFNQNFTFNDAAALVPYLTRLGISHCYASPILKARKGSPHGYDIVDHNALNQEIGSSEDFLRFSDTLAAHGMGLMLDIVPNHMGALGSDNAWWLNVLEHGPASPYADYFDIDWYPLNPQLRGKVLLPVLGDHYGQVLEDGELKLCFAAEQGEIYIQYLENSFPVDPREYPRILDLRADILRTELGMEHPDTQELATLSDALRRLPERYSAEAESRAARVRDGTVYRRLLAELCARSPEVTAFLQENIVLFNGHPGDAESFDSLHRLIEAQAYRLAFWRVAADDINYRRFFDINDLAGLRMEDPAVFGDAHRLIFRLLSEGRVNALRIDHPDGLYDPQMYFRRIQAWRAWRQARRDKGGRSLYLVVEKILADGEAMPPDWPVHGSTGYDFANDVTSLFVNDRARAAFERLYSAFIGHPCDFDTLLYDCKKLIMKSSMASELNVLADHLSHIAQTDRRTRDYTLNGLRWALQEVIAYFPVYRTYSADGILLDADRQRVQTAINQARRNSQAEDVSVFQFLEEVLTLSALPGNPPAYTRERIAFVGKFQQYTGPVMAKGGEDTALYRYQRLTCLNDVGGDPRHFGISVAAFHKSCRDRAAYRPHDMLTSSTHDSKRSEDVRARIAVLSEMPKRWQQALQRWQHLNNGKKGRIDGNSAPDANDEYLIYQTLLGTWPAQETPDADYVERIVAYMRKVVREAKVHSSWINPDSAYEEALERFIRAILDQDSHNPFPSACTDLCRIIRHFGTLNSLGMTLLKLTAPGVPDIYQGCEDLVLHLVDPDNRRPVDFAAYSDALSELESRFSVHVRTEDLQDLLIEPDRGRLKLYLTWRSLEARRQRPELFQSGSYISLRACGKHAKHLCAFARKGPDGVALTVVPRLCFRLLGADESHPLPLGLEVWEDTALILPKNWKALRFRNQFTGEDLDLQGGAEALSVGRLLSRFPLALLLADPESSVQAKS